MLQILPAHAMGPTAHARFDLRSVYCRCAVDLHRPCARRSISDVV